MRWIRQAALTGMLAFAAACPSGDSTGNNGNGPSYPNNPGGTPVLSASVSVYDNYYSPASVNLSAGGTVTWNWIGEEGHSVTPAPGTTFSPVAGVSFPPKSLVVTFGSAGAYQFYCTVHGTDAYGQGAMTGSVFVQ